MKAEIVAELDRQLSEQRASAESMSTRSGLIIAASAGLLGLAALAKTQPSSPWGFWLLGAATALGVAVFWMARVGYGPSLFSAVRRDSADVLADAKLALIEANKTVLTRVQVAFTVQIALAIAGIVVLAVQLWPVP